MISILVAGFLLMMPGLLAGQVTQSPIENDTEQQSPEPLSLEMVFFVNFLANSTWSAAHTSRFNSLDHAISQLGATLKRSYPKFGQALEEAELELTELPREFDARKQWGSSCPSIAKIADQSTCGSCWAVGAATAMTDRICIATAGQFQSPLSVQDLLSCCDTCGDGCQGGYPKSAWDYWVAIGLVTGGEFGVEQVCKPYAFPRCDHHVKGRYKPCGPSLPTPECEKTCQTGYNLDFAVDKHFGQNSYEVAAERMRREIFTHGPVEGAFSVYADFFNYRSGVYQPTVEGEPIGGHAIRILGWGEENGVPYWLVANSWNEDWGDNGLFKILRGQDCCGIESETVAGLPKL